MAEATEGGLKCFVGVSVKVSGLEGLACWSSTTRRKLAALRVAAAVLWLPLGSAGLVE